ncbi:T9SS type A sorting domain-containing protein [Aequorivita todarodis]|uniref:T9SS type A sorting domain-containing protein n=1 Tax=Aequorivita todarodis TaxID=2036821 RepID=UPI0023505F6A|nr:T9SS type A sorting domain-containing protein [Aequorivita todarodis]MDC8001654.1 T9SS type A sorting domain-containing protein [Aequorivita todarodis]
MKNVITFLMCSLCIITGIAQSDLTGNQIVIPEKTPALEALYQEAKALEQNGTAAEINANRLAIKNAWQEIDPEVAALYKPIAATNYPLGGDGSYRPNTIPERPEQTRAPEDWATDKLLRDGYIDGLDMDVTTDGDIYVAAFENFTGSGSDSNLYIYRSTDGGNTFVLWQNLPVISSLFAKIQTITIDGTGDDYLLVYSMFQNGVFQALRWNMASGAFDFQSITFDDVIDFGVDTNFPGTTASQRVFATYNKSDNSTYSARSTAGSYGFDWVDETSLGIFTEQIEFSYGLNGGCYTAFIGFNSRSLRANANDNYNDPASWGTNETVAAGASTESLNPTIRATRKAFASDEVLIIASSRAAGSSNPFDGQAYRRESGAAYVPVSYVTTSSGYDIVHIDTWMSTAGPVEVIESSYVRDRIDDTQDDVNRSNQYDGNTFGPYEGVGDTGRNVFDGFPSAIAETNDGLPCMAFAGTSISGTYGYGLYFDAKNGVTAGIDENSFEGFKFYPNPAQEVLNLSANNTIENVSIFSLIGQKVFETSVNDNETSIDIASLTPGVYLMKAMIDGNSATYKIIKQ